MKYPKWYPAERGALARRIHEMELVPAEAADQLSGLVIDKDADFLRAVVHDWVTAELKREEQRLATAAVRKRRREIEGAAKVAAGHVQPTLDDDLFPGPDSTLLTTDGEYAYDLHGRAERHFKRAERRLAIYEQRLAAVGGNRDGQATRGEAIASLRRAIGDG